MLCSEDYRNVYTQRHVATYPFPDCSSFICLPTYNGYVQNRRRNVIDELIFIRMRGLESGNIFKSIGVNSFVKSFKNVVYELNITQGCKKNYVEI